MRLPGFAELWSQQLKAIACVPLLDTARSMAPAGTEAQRRRRLAGAAALAEKERWREQCRRILAPLVGGSAEGSRHLLLKSLTDIDRRTGRAFQLSKNLPKCFQHLLLRLLRLLVAGFGRAVQGCARKGRAYRH
ncbi:MAG: hypothetical protein JWN24_1782 [Phycisphaerales bacterium]|jgi:hypothetical protein|nr:hypothetical protein [Phycisphaerales bacterium]